MSIKFEYAVVANCNPQYIWRVFQDIEKWRRWTPDAIRSVRWVSGQPWTAGARFEVDIIKPFSYKIIPEIIEVEARFFCTCSAKAAGSLASSFLFSKAMLTGRARCAHSRNFPDFLLRLWAILFARKFLMA